MKNITITDSIIYVGADDKTLDLFESQYKIINGVSYNSYVILDEKVAIIDTVDKRAKDEWLSNIESTLGERTVDYLIVSHMEPDHSANIQEIANKYPNMTIVGNMQTFKMMGQFFDNISNPTLVVREGETLCLGSHTLNFVMAPMVHWPEVMVAYESSEKILFSADGFGKFGALDTDEEWSDEARRYYCNIVGKYGAQVQTLLKKASSLDIDMICPLHGPILKENLSYYIGKYDKWSRYEAEEEGVLVAYASIHGNTAMAAKKMVEILNKNNVDNISLIDISRDDMSKAVADAFRYDKIILMAASYDAGVFPCMEDFLNRMAHKNLQNRKIAYVENGTWAPCAAKKMKSIVSEMKNISEVETVVSIKSVMNKDNIIQMEQLVKEILK